MAGVISRPDLGNSPSAWRPRDRLAAAVLFGTPALVLSASYVFLAIRHHAWNLLPIVVHENGELTLLETIFYVRHFVREWLVCSFMAAAVALSLALNAPAGCVSPVSRVRLHRLRLWLGLGLLTGFAAMLGIVLARDGARELGGELLQMHTRGAVRVFGSHWRYHWLHLADVLPFSAGLALVLRGLTGSGPPTRAIPQLILWWIFAFLAVTLATGSPGPAFASPLYLAHEAREIETHRLLTVSLSVGAIWSLEKWHRPPSRAGMPAPRLLWQGIALTGAATLIPLWIVYRLKGVDITSLASRRTSLLELAAAHHFEHCLDYVFVTALAVWLYLGWVLQTDHKAPD